ncbi:MAG: permease [Gemmatimonadetes bacterium]|nr:permease [Gemmatimonadota bacterium]
MTGPFHELRHAWRRLRRAPLFSLTTLLVLALGIGATTALFSIVNGVLLRPLPYADPERLVSLAHSIVVPGINQVDQSDATFLLYQRHNTVFDGIGSYRDDEVNLASGTGNGADAERVSAVGVSASLLPTLGVTPLAGRTFAPGEDRTNVPGVVLLSQGLWEKKFGGDLHVVGSRVLIDGRPNQIIGIMPARFQFPRASAELWYPTHFDPEHSAPGSFNYQVVARLKPGVSRDAAAADLNRILPRMLDEFPSDIPPAMFEKVHLRSLIRPLRDVVIGDVGPLLWILFGTGGLVLLIACANVANLFLVRGEARHRELAVRTALGASRGTILAQYLSEALLLAALGGAIGLAIAAMAVRALGTLPEGISLPRLGEVAVDARVIAFAVAATLLAAFAVSLIPMLRARKIPLSTVLKDSGRAATSGVAKQHSRNVLVVVQVALALVLVAGSGLMLRSFARLRAVTPGFDADRVLTMRISLPDAKYPNAVARMQYFNALADAVRAIPGVDAAGFTTWLPLGDGHDNGALGVEDHMPLKNTVPAVHDQVWVSAEYFKAMGIPMLSGRSFGAQDAARPSLEAIVSRAFANRYWKDGNPLGKRIRPGIDGPWFTIVGVVGDVHIESLERPADDAAYFAQVTPAHDSGVSVDGGVSLVVRTQGDPSRLTAAVREAVHRLDSTLPTFHEQPMSRVLTDASARTRFTMVLLGVAGVVALTLGAVGIYGVMAYGVSLRQREIGVRMALGARPADVSRMISRQGLGLAAVGVGIGLLAALGLTRFMGRLLYNVSSTDPIALGGTCVLLLAVALVASWLPARRAAAVDPSVALRSD